MLEGFFHMYVNTNMFAYVPTYMLSCAMNGKIKLSMVRLITNRNQILIAVH